MSADNSQHQIDFILQQQAQFASDMVVLNDRLTRLTDTTEKHSQQIGTLTEQIGTLTDALLSLTHIVEQQAEHGKEQAEHGKETDARLDRLIDVVERHIGNH